MSKTMAEILAEITKLKAAAEEAAQAEFTALLLKIEELIAATDKQRVLAEIASKFTPEELAAFAKGQIEATEQAAPADDKSTQASRFTKEELKEFRAKYPVGTVIAKAGKMKGDYTVNSAQIPLVVVEAYKSNNDTLATVQPST